MSTPEGREKERARSRERCHRLRADPEYRARHNERKKLQMRRRRADPVLGARIKEQNRAAWRRVMDDPEKRKRMNKIRNDSYHRRQADPEWQAKYEARRKRNWKNQWRRCQVTGHIGIPGRVGIGHMGGGCGVEGAHLLPQRLCTKEQKKDPGNVILLRADLHRMMDGSWITFGDDGEVLIDRQVPNEIAKEIEGKRVRGWSSANKMYASHHRGWCELLGFDKR